MFVARRGLVRIDSLVAGDMVADGSGDGFSAFMTYLHFDNESTARFVEVTVEGMATPLLLTPEHLLFVARSSSDPDVASAGAVRADTVRPGHLVLEGGGDGTPGHRARSVKAVRLVVNQGFAAPLTASGRIAVNGIVASCYADLMGHPHDQAHTAMQPLILLGQMFPSLVQHDRSHSDIHWYAQVLVRLVQLGDAAAARLAEMRAMLS